MIFSLQAQQPHIPQTHSLPTIHFPPISPMIHSHPAVMDLARSQPPSRSPATTPSQQMASCLMRLQPLMHFPSMLFPLMAFQMMHSQPMHFQTPVFPSIVSPLPQTQSKILEIPLLTMTLMLQPLPTLQNHKQQSL